MSESLDDAKKQQESSFLFKLHLSNIFYALALIGVGTLTIQYVLNIDVSFSRFYTILTALDLGFFGYMMVFEQSPMFGKHEQDHLNEVAKIRVVGIREKIKSICSMEDKTINSFVEEISSVSESFVEDSVVY